MHDESRFGNQVFECNSSMGEMLKKRLLYLLPAIVFIAAGAATSMFPEVMEGEEELMPILLALFFGVGIIFVLLSILRVKSSKAVIYEDGLVHIRSLKVTEVKFGDIKGIRDWVERTMWFAAIIPVFALKTRTITIEKKDGATIQLNKTLVPDFNRFSDKLNSVFTEYLFKGVTKENLNRTSISFGAELELSNGQLLYNKGKKEGKVVIPFDAILSIEISSDGYYILLVGEEREKKKFKRTDILAAIATGKALNVDAFYRIVQMNNTSVRV